jgi:hypothetical protein
VAKNFSGGFWFISFALKGFSVSEETSLQLLQAGGANLRILLHCFTQSVDKAYVSSNKLMK